MFELEEVPSIFHSKLISLSTYHFNKFSHLISQHIATQKTTADKKEWLSPLDVAHNIKPA